MTCRVMTSLAAALLAGCGESETTPPVRPAEAPATVEADPHTVTSADPRAATDAPLPEPIDDVGERLYREGRPMEAIAYWEKAAVQGDGYASYRLGLEYLDARVVERDVAKAAAWQKRAAELGDPRGMFVLATLYEYGQGVEQSDEQAAKYYLMAAERGLPEAQHNIATRFESGTGVKKNQVEAYKFHALARAQGFIAAGDYARGHGDEPDPMLALEDVMSTEQLAEARRRIAEFQSRSPPD